MGVPLSEGERERGTARGRGRDGLREAAAMSMIACIQAHTHVSRARAESRNHATGILRRNRGIHV